jgi:hypothetical protein
VVGQLLTNGWNFQEILGFNISGISVCIPIENQELWSLRYGMKDGNSLGSSMRQQEGCRRHK